MKSSLVLGSNESIVDLSEFISSVSEKYIDSLIVQ